MDPRIFVGRSVFVLVCWACLSWPAWAQGVGAIGGTVMDETGAVLPGATVTLSAAQGTIGSNQETVSDGRGAYQFLRLVPGTYVVSATLQGFRRIQQPNIVVNADTTARADLRLDLGTIEEGIVVSGAAPLLDTTTVLKQTVISREELQSLPNRTNVYSMVSVIPGIVIGKIDVGGTERFLSSSLTVRGSAIENKFMIDSMDITGTTGTGSSATLYLIPYVYEESNFQVGAGSAEHAIGGFTINMVTRTGTNRLRGGAMVNYTPPAWAQSRNYSPALRDQLLANVPARALAANPGIQPHADLRRMRDFGAWLSAPVVRDNLWYAGAWSDQRMDRYLLGNYDRDGKPVLDENVMYTTTNKLSWQATRSAQLSYFHGLQYKLIGRRGGGVFADDRARQYNYKYPNVNQVKFTSPFRSKMAVDVGYSRLVSNDVSGNRPEVKLGDVATFDTTTQVSGVALPVYDLQTALKHQIKGSLSWFGGKHDIKTGYEYVLTSRGITQWTISGMRALFASGVPTGVNTYLVALSTEDRTDPQNVPLLFKSREDAHGVYVQDKWTPYRKLVLNLGLRYESSTSWQPASCRPETVFYAGSCFDEVTPPAFGDVAPRFNLVYDLRGDGRTALKFAANRYNQQIGVSIVQRLNPIGEDPVFDQRQWLAQSRCGDPGVLGCDRNGDLIPQLNEIGPSPGYVFPGVTATYADGLKRPVSNEYAVELQHELPQRIVGSVGYVYRQTRRNIGQRNMAVPLSAWIGPITVTEVTSSQTVQVWRRPSAASANLFFNSEEFDTDFHGVDITFTKRMSNRWSMRGGATFGTVTSATRGGNRNDPHITSYFDSNVLTAGDRPWSGRLTGVYQLPYDLFLSGSWQIQPGAPEATTVLVTNQTITLPQGNQAIQVAPVGDVRYPNLTQLDLNIRKVWGVGGGKTIAPRLEIFNATNSGTIDLWVTQLGPAYHRPSSLQRGRLVKMEVDFEF